MDKAGYHRSVFYTYFKDIYDLLEQEQEDFFIQNIWPKYYTNNVKNIDMCIIKW